MQGITFSLINTKIFNIVLCVILPLVVLACLSAYTSTLNKFDAKWLLSADFLKMIVVLMCYAIPLTYFLSKVYELTAGSEDSGSSVFAFIAACVLILPLAFIALVMFAKLSFVIPILLTLAIAFLYYRSLKLVAC
ncbi:hypothetical protein [Mucilaginibacter auburnensis]|uniref:Uncharacterized protein n=1 Tax=Mucilaginibacter auburnensis TaxID=1457233 RepID=A0A2H9VNL7_9SPHI|nr:hypothetical protein [Mucilaginibacter auburnensis]PJJ79902.1 hypothetical protein CLV57_3041 [Mucilaginibacter auburnensis]